MIYWLAPMDWITDLPFRIITKKIFEKYNTNKNIDFILWTEFMTSNWYLANKNKVINHIIHTDFEYPIILQIFGGDKNILLKTAQDIEKNQKNLFWIELNTWCPANNVMKSWWWSALLKDKKKLLETIKNISQNIKTPFSIKTRTGIDEKDKKEQIDFLIQASKYCHIISVHSRTLKELYSWGWDWDFIYKLKNEVWNNCKIVWNWWINNYQDILDKSKMNIDWIMIWQWAIWNPRIFTNHEPSEKEKFETIIEHINLMAKYEIFTKNIESKNIKINIKEIEDINIEENLEEIKYTPLLFRKHLHKYLKNINRWKKLKEKCNKETNFKNTINEISDFLEQN